MSNLEDMHKAKRHDEAFDNQLVEHVYQLLKAQLVAELECTHEPDEITESVMLHEPILRNKAKSIVKTRFW